MKPRKPIKRSSRPSRSTTPTRRSPIKSKKRKPSEFARIYGSKARVAWMKQQPSVASGLRPCVGHHIKTGGTGRKADYTKIVPLTHDEHLLLHWIGMDSFEKRHGFSLERMAAQIELRWQSHCARVSQETKHDV